MESQNKLEMAGSVTCEAKTQPAKRYRAYAEMLGKAKKERNEYAEQN